MVGLREQDFALEFFPRNLRSTCLSCVIALPALIEESRTLARISCQQANRSAKGGWSQITRIGQTKQEDEEKNPVYTLVYILYEYMWVGWANLFEQITTRLFAV